MLVTLRDDAPLPHPMAALVVREPDGPKLATWLRAQGFRSTLLRLGLEAHAAAAPAAAPAEKSAAEAPAQAAHAPAAGFGPYETVTTLDQLKAWIAEATAAGVVGVDTETDGLDAMRAHLVGCSLATAAGRACYVPLRHEAPTAELALDATAPAQAAMQQIAPEQAVGELAPLLADPAVLKVFHNAKFDLMMLARAGAPVAHPIDDSMVISFAQDAGAHGHGMDELSGLHLGHTPISYDQVTGTGRGRIPFGQVPLDRATAYAAEDADVTLRLWQALRPRLRTNKALALYEQVDRRLIPVLLDMERAGVKLDAADLRAMSKDFEQRMAVMETQIHKLAGEPFNLASGKQLGEILFERMKLTGGRRMKTGAWGTDASVLQGLAEQGHDLPARILEWRQLAKLKSTYADALVEEINPDTGRVHTSFAMAMLVQHRPVVLDRSEPAKHPDPNRGRQPHPPCLHRRPRACAGRSADYSQIELRLLAHVADIAALKESFARGEDIHARTASEVFGIPMAGMDPMTRRRAKAINFGIIYGISAFGLARQLQIEPGEARVYIDAYFARYPGIRAYMEKTKEEARIAGYVLTPFGRRCWIPGIADKNPARRAYAERQAINAPLQGGAADIIKRAMVRLPAALRAAGLKARLLLQVHDELLFEATEAEAEATAKLAQQVMGGAASLSVPLVVETGSGHNWAAAH